MKTLRLILGDQLNSQHSWFNSTDSSITYLMVEAKAESTYVTHHIQKVVGFFAAMRSFRDWLVSEGHHVIYHSISDSTPHTKISEFVAHSLSTESFDRFEYQESDEYRLDNALASFCKQISIPSEMVSSEHFYAPRNGVEKFFKSKKTYLMEPFYRFMRKRFDILMENGQPMGDKWNFDEDNRKPFKYEVPIPKLDIVKNNVQSIVNEIRQAGIQTIGAINAQSFEWPINREQALTLLQHFCTQQLQYFGTYEDAMVQKEPILFHSRLSFALNSKLLSPQEVVEAVINEWKSRPNEIKLNQVEGFIRQIIGWREFMRGVYWAEMPEFESLNFFNFDRPLPSWFWNGDTKMNCLKHCITQSLEMAWAHHIQRLMITGNFALLAGINPDDVDEWYLGIYIDAIQWVEITNTRGMSQYADGGKIASKPYVSSAQYIDKMSDYCSSCYYRKKIKTGPKACPFNSLYWNFYHTNRTKLEGNPRIGMMFKIWDKMGEEKQQELLQQANYYLNHIEDL